MSWLRFPPFPTARPPEHHEVQPPVPLRPSRSLFHPPTLWLGVFLLLILLGSYDVHPVSFSTILLAGFLSVLRSFVSFHVQLGSQLSLDYTDLLVPQLEVMSPSTLLLVLLASVLSWLIPGARFPPRPIFRSFMDPSTPYARYFGF